jgi:hypothetical protein
MEPGTFWLFACPWFFTVVGRFVRHVNFQEMEIEDALYFTRTGATFDVLCTKGMVPGREGSKYHPLPGRVIIPTAGLKIPWLAPTPWVKS